MTVSLYDLANFFIETGILVIMLQTSAGNPDEAAWRSLLPHRGGRIMADENPQSHSDRRAFFLRRIAAPAVLLCSLYLYIGTFSDRYFAIFSVSTFQRFMVRTACYCLFQRLDKGLSWIRCLYDAFFAVVCYTVCYSIVLSPVFREWFGYSDEVTVWVSSPALNFLIVCLIHLVVLGLPLLIVSLLAPLCLTQRPSALQWSVLSINVVIALYVKNTMGEFTFTGQAQSMEMSVFAIMVSLLLLAFIVIFSRSQYSARVGEELRLQEVTDQYRMRSMEQKLDADADVRRLHHDMKNHLLALQTMAEEGAVSGDGAQSMHQYIAELLGDLKESELHVETGNTLLNGLLSQKVQEAQSENIEVETILNFKAVTWIDPKDLCTIFGNALDNAIEACRRMDRTGVRRISIHSRIEAGQLILVISNSCQGGIQMENGLPKTSKPDAASHGMGLRNIRRALAKYDGILDISVTSDAMPSHSSRSESSGWFRLVMVIPVKQ